MSAKQREQSTPRGFGGGGSRMALSGEKANDFKGTFKRLFARIRPYRKSFIVAMCFALLGVVISVLSPMILGMITTELFEGSLRLSQGIGGINWNLIGKIVLILIGTYLASPLARYLQNYIMVGLSQKVVYNLRKEVNEKLDRLPLSYFDSRTQGEIMSRITNDIETVSQSLQEGINQTLVAIFTMIGIIVMMVSISVWMTLVGLIVIPLALILSSFIIKKSQKHFMANQKHLGEVNGYVEEMYGGHEVIKVFNHEDASIKEFDELNGKLYQDGWKSNFYSSIMMPLIGFAGDLGYVLVVVFGAILASRGQITVGNIQAFIQYMRRFTQPIREVANIANVFQSTAAAAERVFELLDANEDPSDISEAYTADSIQGTVEFSHVQFGYSPDKILINDLNFNIPCGTKVAIVGPTGAGKTTLINLLMRFYDVNQGSILVDGTDIRDWNRDSLRDQFGMVLQDTWLFNGTIKENIAYGTGNPSEPTLEEVREAAKIAYADHFIQTLPGGYDMMINEEADNISQGQKQLLTIARAFISNPQILILDEATSNVDTRTELLIQKAMKNLMKGRTSFIIAHRLSTIRDADLILVLRDGDIVEQGNHETLLAENGFYAELYNSQFASKTVS